jgi:hypothetical protein
MALAMRVTPRVWLGGEGSAPRALTLIRRLLERGRRCAARRPLLWCTDGWCSYIRAMRATLRDLGRTGQGGRRCRRPGRTILIAHVVTGDERRRGGDTERRMVDGTPARVETLRRRAQGDGVLHTADIERLHATFRARRAPLARHTRTLEHGMSLVGTVSHCCPDHTRLRRAAQTPGTGATNRTPARAAGITDQGWSVRAL